MAKSIGTAHPATDEFYEGLLLSIDPQYADRIHSVLQWLAFADEPLLNNIDRFSRHPLTLLQITQVVSVDHSHRLPSYQEERLLSPDRIKELGSGLLKLEEVPANRYASDAATVTRLTFVSDTVREFLVSDRIRSGPASRYHVCEPEAHENICNTCLAYILHITEMDGNASKIAEMHPLATFAAFFWIDFLPEHPSPNTWELISSLFSGSPVKYRAWLRLVFLADRSYLNNKHTGVVLALSGKTIEGYGCIAPPIVWASALGLTHIVETLIRQEHDVNAAGASKASALYMAVREDHRDVLELLLRHGGDVATNYAEPTSSWDLGETSRSPLYNASRFGKANFLELLLQDKSKYGRSGWVLEIAIRHAARFNKIECLQHLINAGVNLDSIGFDLDGTGGIKPEGGCILQEAAWHHSTETVKLLLNAGADVNTRGGNYDTALQAAAWRGHSDITNMLLDAGADITFMGGTFGTPLIASCWKGKTKTAEMLLRAGCDVDVQWDLTDNISELNFMSREEYSKGESDPRTEAEKKYPYSSTAEKGDEAPQSPTKEGDRDPASESSLRKRIAANMLSHAEFQKKLFGFYPDRNDNPFKILAEIRQGADRISSRLREAGVQVGEHGRYFFNAVQAAVASDRHDILSLLFEHGVAVPLVIVVGEEQASEEAEEIARRLRVRQSFTYQMRRANGSIESSGSSMLPH